MLTTVLYRKQRLSFKQTSDFLAAWLTQFKNKNKNRLRSRLDYSSSLDESTRSRCFPFPHLLSSSPHTSFSCPPPPCPPGPPPPLLVQQFFRDPIITALVGTAPHSLPQLTVKITHPGPCGCDLLKHHHHPPEVGRRSLPGTPVSIPWRGGQAH